MQTERVTFLTTPDHKAALDAFAASNGRSVGHVVREATARYMAGGRPDDYEQALELMLPEVETALAKWHRQLDSIEASLADAHEAVRRALADVERTKR